MSKHKAPQHGLEILEQRIAPAAVVPLNEAGFKAATVGTPLLLHAGEGLSTGGPKAGAYLLYIEKGDAMIFTTDFNLNGIVDFNEITGIAAGDGLRMISFVDIHGDIVTNLKADFTLSDGNNDPVGDDKDLRGDGRVLLNNTIEKIELRSLTLADIGDQDNEGETDDSGKFLTDEFDVGARLSLSSYSIFGNVLAGKGFGVEGDLTSGLLIDVAGRGLQSTFFPGGIETRDFYQLVQPMIGSIKVGSAASGTYFSFGVSAKDDIQGRISTFVPVAGQAGGDISHVRAAAITSQFNLDSLEAGNGGLGARGGNINDIHLNGDNAGGYRIIAGNGGRGENGGAGGSLVDINDLGSITGAVLIKTGDGGKASTGVGGNGGNVKFGTLNLNGGITLQLGNGGDGFTAGGNGANLTEGIITTPEGAVQYGLSVVATSVSPSKNSTPSASDAIGTTIPVDFNENGFGDFVYAASDANQLVVVLDGDPLAKISLDGPILAYSVVVGDFNGDGHQDIAAASKDVASFGGISVFLSIYEDTNRDGILSESEDVNRNGIDDFLGFTGAIRSVLPALDGLDVPGTTLGNLIRRSGVQVVDMAAGDFNGDGNLELAVVVNYYFGIGNAPRQLMLFMSPDVEDFNNTVDDLTDDRPTGQFYLDYGTKAGAGVPANFLLPVFAFRGGDGQVQIESSFLSTSADHAVIFAGVRGEGGPNSGFALRTIEYLGSPTAPAVLSSWILGRVDTDRLLPEGNNTHINLQDATLLEFTVLDVNGPLGTGPDGNADVVVLTEQPDSTFLVGFYGDGLGKPLPDKLSDAAGGTQNAGIALSRGDGTRLGIGENFVGIRATDSDGNGKNDVALLNFEVPGSALYNVNVLTLSVRATGGDNGATNTLAIEGYGHPTPNVIAWDSYTYDLTDPGTVGYAVSRPSKEAITLHEINLVGPGVPIDPLTGEGYATPLADNGLTIIAGDGGNALVGRGGIGGSIGGGLSSTRDPLTGQTLVTGAIDITFTNNLAFEALTYFYGGKGGNGFTTGGKGGDITGLSVRTPNGVNLLTVSLYGGDGGFGVAGSGGAGGNLLTNSIQDGNLFVAGNGGRGLIGGAGGSVVGNPIATVYDTQVGPVQVFAGTGGNGVKAGGAGGDISNFHPFFLSRGSLEYTAGDGGNAVSGPGGRGGSISKSDPIGAFNILKEEISVTAGNGGRGLTGGAGGNISDFVNRATTADNPSVVSFIAGHGGTGITGNGGTGGNVINVLTASKGSSVLVAETPFNRVLAGNGGQSAGANGGNGGTVSGVNVTASDGSMAVAAGAGGTGLTAGGNGGSVLNVIGQVGGEVASKLLVIAGAGGDATAFIPNKNDNAPNQAQTAFGGRVGKGGNGGSILNFEQQSGTFSRVDLISGNGGSTLNYGTITPGEKLFAGIGGSIEHIRIAGNLGNYLPDVALKSYNDNTDVDNDGRVDQTVAQFVDTFLRLGAATPLTDDVGNVGIIVGIAGRLKATQIGQDPAVPIYDLQPSSGRNGILNDVTARNLTSAVAGSIDRVASIQSVSGLQIGFRANASSPLSPGIVGADKTPVGSFDYLDAAGNPSVVPVLDGTLIDGAIVAKTYSNNGPLIGRVFNL